MSSEQSTDGSDRPDTPEERFSAELKKRRVENTLWSQRIIFFLLGAGVGAGLMYLL